MRLISFHQLALDELEGATRWYEERDSRVCDHFLNALDLSVERLSQDPESYATVDNHYRSISVINFPYRLIFRLASADEIAVVAVAHASRKPGYWKGRESQ